MSDSQDQLSRQTADLQALLAKVRVKGRRRSKVFSSIMNDASLVMLSLQMQTSFQENLATIQSNFASLESRISSLKA